MKIAIAGTGYVGLVTGVCLASIGHEVTCVDIDKQKIQMMSEGQSPIYEQNLAYLMQSYANNLTYTTDYRTAYSKAEVIFIGVGTPERVDGYANLNYVYRVAEEIAESLIKDCVVVVKSTVPIGTNDKLEKFITDRLKHQIHIEIVSNPEFLSQGTAVNDTLHASRIVLGVESKRAEEIMRKVYDNFQQPYVFTNRRSAEMIKYASNDFLALKLSYVNEIANLCEIVGADIDDVTKGMGYDARIGNRFLKAGIGYGGSCFPKDTKALNWLSNYYDYELKTVKASIEVNENQKIKLIKKARKYYENLNGLTVAILGLSFKPGTDDLREAPSLVNIPIILEDKAVIKAWDPVAQVNYQKLYPDQIAYCDTIEETIKDADLCFIFTEWDEIKQFDTDKFDTLMRNPIVLDGRNCYSLDKFSGKKTIYDSIGRKRIIGNRSDNIQE
jgi:UDPglucose 6-dehydrogenase